MTAETRAPAQEQERTMLMVDGRCDCERCRARTENIYRMIGTCVNCGYTPILMLFRAGDRATSRTCPKCGVWNTVQPQRLATDDEIPVGAALAPVGRGD